MLEIFGCKLKIQRRNPEAEVEIGETEPFSQVNYHSP